MRLEQSINEKLIEEKFKSKISERDLTIQELREMKSRLSTKMVGETLEIHCETQFNLNRASAFKNSYFEKDNDATSGSKGDYIFREFDKNKTEVVSIMFEMKNESLNGSCNCLSYPPCCIGREFITPSILKFINCFHQAYVSLLDQI